MTVRFYVPGEVHHVIARLVDRKFYMNLEEARPQYLRYLGAALPRTDWKCLAYALMSNHIHLLMLAGELAPETLFRRIHPPFVQWLNVRHGGLGVVVAARPKMHVVPAADFSTRIAYVHNNPVRAKVVATAADSTWTSHRAYLGLATAPPWLDVSEGLRRAGYDVPEDFDRWVRSDTSTSEQIREAELRAQRAARLAHRRGAIEVGTPIGTDAVPLAARRWARIRRDPREIVEVISRLTGASSEEIRSRARKAVDGRRLAITVGVAAGYSIAEVSATLGITRQAGSRLLRAQNVCDSRIVSLATEMLSTDDWAEQVDKGDSEREQLRGRIAGGRKRS